MHPIYIQLSANTIVQLQTIDRKFLLFTTKWHFWAVCRWLGGSTSIAWPTWLMRYSFACDYVRPATSHKGYQAGWSVGVCAYALCRYCTEMWTQNKHSKKVNLCSVSSHNVGIVTHIHIINRYKYTSVKFLGIVPFNCNKYPLHTHRRICLIFPANVSYSICVQSFWVVIV